MSKKQEKIVRASRNVAAQPAAAQPASTNARTCPATTSRPNFFRRVWDWFRSLDVVGMINITLVCAIIVLFGMLIMDFTKCKSPRVIYIADTAVPVVKESVKKNQESVVLPLKKPASQVTITRAKYTPVEPAAKMFGTIIIDGLIGDVKIIRNTHIDGTVYLQDMRIYTLPCDTVINGDLFVRNVGMLKFCGDFIVTGNIYVSSTSSFGPIPKTAKLGGYIVL